MKTKHIIGRTKECERLENCMESDTAQLIIVYGRRRVGKTTLINKFIENNKCKSVSFVSTEMTEKELEQTKKILNSLLELHKL